MSIQYLFMKIAFRSMKGLCNIRKTINVVSSSWSLARLGRPHAPSLNWQHHTFIPLQLQGLMYVSNYFGVIHFRDIMPNFLCSVVFLTS